MPLPLSFEIEAQQREILSRADRHTYKPLAGGDDLDLYVIAPEEDRENSPAIMFFHGGGLWERGKVSQFIPHALHFASRGLNAILVDYRLGAGPEEGVGDICDAIDWVCGHADKLGVDCGRIALAGASSGAQGCLLAALDPERLSSLKDDKEPFPGALVLFSPIVSMLRSGVIDSVGGKGPAKKLSPLEFVAKRQPPVLIFHGGDDRVQPVAEVDSFTVRMQKKRNRCWLYVYENQRSTFFNFNVNAELYEATLNMADDFLVEAGVIDKGGDGSGDGGTTTRLA